MAFVNNIPLQNSLAAMRYCGIAVIFQQPFLCSGGIKKS